jgi:hypothetical protein
MSGSFLSGGSGIVARLLLTGLSLGGAIGFIIMVLISVGGA